MSYIYCNICNIWFLDAKLPDRWIGRDGPTLWPPRSPDITLLNSFYGGMLRAKIFDTSSRYYEFEGKNNRRFCYSNWRHVGEHVERNWLSIRRSPCNKRSTCWSVLICCKKTSWVSYISKKKSLYSTFNSFLVINVFNQGKTLCSPCRYTTQEPLQIVILLRYNFLSLRIHDFTNTKQKVWHCNIHCFNFRTEISVTTTW